MSRTSKPAAMTIFWVSFPFVSRKYNKKKNGEWTVSWTQPSSGADGAAHGSHFRPRCAAEKSRLLAEFRTSEEPPRSTYMQRLGPDLKY